MKKTYTIEKMSNCRTRYTFDGKNAKGESVLVELIACENPGGKNALPVLWKKRGFIDRVLNTYWCVNTYVTDKDGNCWGRYNPTSKRSEDGKRSVLDFAWMFEATQENAEKLLNEIYRRATA